MKIKMKIKTQQTRYNTTRLHPCNTFAYAIQHIAFNKGKVSPQEDPTGAGAMTCRIAFVDRPAALQTACL